MLAVQPGAVLEGLVVQTKLAKLVTPALIKLRDVDKRALVSLFGKLGKLEDLDLSVAGELIGTLGAPALELVNNVDPLELRKIARELLVATFAITAAGRTELKTDDAFTQTFGGDVLMLLKAMVWVAGHNFPFVQRAFAAPAKAKDEGSSSTTSAKAT